MICSTFALYYAIIYLVKAFAHVHIIWIIASKLINLQVSVKCKLINNKYTNIFLFIKFTATAKENCDLKFNHTSI